MQRLGRMSTFLFLCIGLAGCQAEALDDAEGTSEGAISGTPTDAKNARALAAETAEMERFRDLYTGADETAFERTPYEHPIPESKFAKMRGEMYWSAQPNVWFKWQVPEASTTLRVVEVTCKYAHQVFGAAPGEVREGPNYEKVVLIYDADLVLRAVFRTAKDKWLVPSAVPSAPKGKYG